MFCLSIIPRSSLTFLQATVRFLGDWGKAKRGPPPCGCRSYILSIIAMLVGIFRRRIADGRRMFLIMYYSPSLGTEWRSAGVSVRTSLQYRPDTCSVPTNTLRKGLGMEPLFQAASALYVDTA